MEQREEAVKLVRVSGLSVYRVPQELPGILGCYLLGWR